jgi:hypothetical protein
MRVRQALSAMTDGSGARSRQIHPLLTPHPPESTMALLLPLCPHHHLASKPFTMLKWSTVGIVHQANMNMKLCIGWVRDHTIKNIFILLRLRRTGHSDSSGTGSLGT